jgi:all-trans-retinol 13,14-reductase
METVYDVIIIGSGLGGLECATILSKHGYRVCVLEKNTKLGGTLHGFKRHGCEFGTGMHYIGSLDEGQVTHKLFKYLGILHKIQIKRMDADGFDHFNIAGKEYKYAMGKEAFTELLSSYFPNKTEEIAQYYREIEMAVNQVDVYNLKPLKDFDIRTNHALNTSAFEKIKSITRNAQLRNVMGALNFVHAGEKEKTPFYTHALINKYYIDSAYKLVDGSYQIASSLAENIKNAGGDVLIKEKVSEFISKDGKITAVKTEQGNTFFGKQFISNIHPSLTIDMLDGSMLRKSYRKRITNLGNTISTFTLHLKLKDNSFPYLNYNYHYFKKNDVWYPTYYSEKNWPEFYYLFVPAKSDSDNYTNCISIHTYMKFEEVEKWKDLPIRQRGDAYEDWKASKVEKLIQLVSEKFPEIKENIEGMNISTPLTLRDYIGTPDGGMYGISIDYKNPMATYVAPRTKIPNLFFTGQNVSLHGMLGVSMSSLITCGELLGINNLINEINET